MLEKINTIIIDRDDSDLEAFESHFRATIRAGLAAGVLKTNVMEEKARIKKQNCKKGFKKNEHAFSMDGVQRPRG